MPRNKNASKIDGCIIAQVRKFRIKQGFSQSDIAHHLKVSPAFISHIEMETMRARYNLIHLNELAKLFQCSMKDFFPGKPL